MLLFLLMLNHSLDCSVFSLFLLHSKDLYLESVTGSNTKFHNHVNNLMSGKKKEGEVLGQSLAF